ncbi:hypothetical protein V6Z11_D02G276900 [Gossypium hirsutum]
MRLQNIFFLVSLLSFQPIFLLNHHSLWGKKTRAKFTIQQLKPSFVNCYRQAFLITNKPHSTNQPLQSNSQATKCGRLSLPYH